MKYLILISALLLGACNSKTVCPSVQQNAFSHAEVLQAFLAIKTTPFDSDPFLRHAYISGYISAFSLGPASLGALRCTPSEFASKDSDAAFRQGHVDGATQACKKFDWARMSSESEIK